MNIQFNIIDFEAKKVNRNVLNIKSEYIPQIGTFYDLNEYKYKVIWINYNEELIACDIFLQEISNHTDFNKNIIDRFNN